jgi:ABC-type bacteriocin/lantibiotic exporter with double-glycine peptidase domain
METEKQILSEIKSLKGHKTFVIIAHNYATLKYCDVIYEVIDKELVPRGRYEDIKSK